MQILTKRQNEILIYIKKYIAANTFPPSIREICNGTNLSSTATVAMHLNNLELKKYIKIGKNKSRNIELLCNNEFIENTESIIKSSFITENKSINPMEEIRNKKNITYLTSYITHNEIDVFTIKQTKNDLINELIFENDYLIFSIDKIPNNNDIIAIYSKDEIKIRKYIKEKDFIILKSDNEKEIVKEITILGTLVSSYKFF